MVKAGTRSLRRIIEPHPVARLRGRQRSDTLAVLRRAEPRAAIPTRKSAVSIERRSAVFGARAKAFEAPSPHLAEQLFAAPVPGAAGAAPPPGSGPAMFHASGNGAVLAKIPTLRSVNVMGSGSYDGPVIGPSDYACSEAS